MRKWFSLALLALGLTAATTIGLGGCDSDDVDIAAQCADVCNAYIDCTDNTLDRDDCADSCEDFANEDNTKPAFEGCEDCVDSNACEGDSWQCGTECDALIDAVTP